jgi:hypothetical protein
LAENRALAACKPADSRYPAARTCQLQKKELFRRTPRMPISGRPEIGVFRQFNSLICAVGSRQKNVTRPLLMLMVSGQVTVGPPSEVLPKRLIVADLPGRASRSGDAVPISAIATG